MDRTGPGAKSSSELYNEEYYETHCSKGAAAPYRHGEREWEEFYAGVADNVVRSLAPRTVYDAGCAIGFLVEALWDRGAEAHGRDISEFAIDHVRPDVRDYCSVGSITDPIEGTFDLVICVEVLEHLSPTDASLAVKQMTGATDRILFSSTPTDFDEPTHINVRPPIYWLRLFAEYGFAPVLSYDATYLCAHALLFERSKDQVAEETMLGAASLVCARVRRQEEGARRIELNMKLAQSERKSAEYRSALDGAWLEVNSLSEELARERAVLTSVSAELEGSRQRIHHLEAAEARLHSIEYSVFWRMTSPLRKIADAVPGGLRRSSKRFVVASWRLVTLRRFRGQPASGHTVVPGTHEITAPHPSFAASEEAVPLAVRQFAYLEPLNVFRAPVSHRTVNVVTDSISPGSLFGGVGTALLLAASLATRIGAVLRVVTRSDHGDSAVVSRLLRTSGFVGDVPIETTLVGRGSGTAVSMGDGDYFIPTSWWTALPTTLATGYDKVVYLLQEDERMFYPMGDQYLRCSETLSDTRLRTVVNSEMLFRHFTEGAHAIPGLAERAVWFEPAFPEELFYYDPAAHGGSAKRTFLFYARPNNVRNLYWRGLEAIEQSLRSGVLDPDRWRFVFLGKDVEAVPLPGNPELVTAENLSWDDYAREVRRADVGLSLIYSPHPSYPPLDLAASGAVVVTNSFGTAKQDLSSYSRNIVCAEPTAAALTFAIAAAVDLSEDTEARLRNLGESAIVRDWASTLSPVVDQIIRWFDETV